VCVALSDLCYGCHVCLCVCAAFIQPCLHNVCMYCIPQVRQYLLCLYIYIFCMCMHVCTQFILQHWHQYAKKQTTSRSTCTIKIHSIACMQTCNNALIRSQTNSQVTLYMWLHGKCPFMSSNIVAIFQVKYVCVYVCIYMYTYLHIWFGMSCMSRNTVAFSTYVHVQVFTGLCIHTHAHMHI
jgi:hypothetical protein